MCLPYNSVTHVTDYAACPDYTTSPPYTGPTNPPTTTGAPYTGPSTTTTRGTAQLCELCTVANNCADLHNGVECVRLIGTTVTKCYPWANNVADYGACSDTTPKSPCEHGCGTTTTSESPFFLFITHTYHQRVI